MDVNVTYPVNNVVLRGADRPAISDPSNAADLRFGVNRTLHGGLGISLHSQRILWTDFDPRKICETIRSCL